MRVRIKKYSIQCILKVVFERVFDISFGVKLEIDQNPALVIVTLSHKVYLLFCYFWCSIKQH